MRRFIAAAFLTVSCLGTGISHGTEPTATADNDLTRITCAELAQESEENRSYALIFYYGYLAGRSNVSTVDTAQVSDQLLRVRDHCMANPDSTVIEAFTTALK